MNLKPNKVTPFKKTCLPRPRSGPGSAGYAAFSLVPEDHRILTIEFKINFLNPAFSHALVCRSRILREGGQILVGESEVFDQRPDGEVLVAKAIVTLRSIHQSKIKPAPQLKE